ncbi:type II toxin-antitoxin system ParD family antitoxin [Aurantimonas sp. VKM B-3413]|uniref:type II toxin-antitoxin system ParD family antitoxin n=1 Tax=Aurantimonas sp. VKM B-3413 TaxID=2779401 RepID=UPI001E55C280|nr:type II toxin-antitoxin system ParD family antitoxin [Aurantimonas sp. VKM B-3413]MCB8839413.1 type II toxin-antitoxin system ParD family antitoxin [Aurantimonas sp. VKM B-3413]
MASVTIGEHYERMLQSMVESGRYATASEVVRDGLRLVEEREQLREAKLAALRQLIDEGEASGPAKDLDMAAIKAAAQRRRTDRKAAS